MPEGGRVERVLHVVWSPFEAVAHIVSPRTLAAAQAADEAPFLVDFGDLRRSGDLDELSERLQNNGEGELDEYVEAIERAAGRQPASDDLSKRLDALADMPFDGLDEDDFDPGGGRYLPADGVDFRSDWEIDIAPAEEYRGYDVIAKAMSTDIPSDVFKEFAESRYGNSPAFSGHIDDSVPADRLDALITVLEARGYTVIRDDS